MKRPLTADTLLTVTAAAEAVGGSRAKVVAWIREHVQVRNIAGLQRVRWGDVLRASEVGSAVPARRRARRLRRADLG